MLEQLIGHLKRWWKNNQLKKTPPRRYTYEFVDSVDKRIERPVTFMGRGYLFHSGVRQTFTQFEVVAEEPVWIPAEEHRNDPLVTTVPMVKDGHPVNIAAYLDKRIIR